VLRYAVRLAVAAFLAAAGLGVPAAAHAATCSTSHGVTVVVDFHQLGGGVQAACDPEGAGRTGAQQMSDVGHHLTYVQRQPGFVCRVDGSPADDPCVNTPPDNAYWSLWWSDGKSGTWSYAAQGIGALQVPDGGYVALSWQGGDGKAAPRVTPRALPAPAPSPTHKPSRHPTASATSSPPDTPSSTPTSRATRPPTATPLHQSTRKPSPSTTAPSQATRSADTTQTAGTPEQGVDDSDDAASGGLPAWVAPVLVVVLLGAAATVAVVRRKRSGGA
jgi:hypothetical protein